MSDARDVFHTLTEGKALIVIPAGDHVGFQIAQIESGTDAILELVERAGLSHIVFDAGESSYLSSSMIGAMIRMWEAVSAGGGQFLTCCLTEDALRAIAVTRLDSHWPQFDSRAAALQALKSGE
ncbi:MAG: STAS domain-containing protein [Planctomycetaceae bacterium]